LALVSVLHTPSLASTSVYFSRIDDPEQAIIDCLTEATSTLEVAMYSFTDQDLADSVLAAYRRGVTVRVYLDKGQRTANYSKGGYLAEHGVTVRYASNSALMHNKFAVCDGATVITGSYNWSASASERNNENLLIIRDPTV
jgi:phosphatidylserine/phosphatidylglycerophosphate/cardiolipin synthase-like enzyme